MAWPDLQVELLYIQSITGRQGATRSMRVLRWVGGDDVAGKGGHPAFC